MTKATDAQLAARSALDYLVSWLDYRIWRTRIPGAQVAVWLGGELRLSRGFGLADVAEVERMTTTHQFRVASHSKLLTAIAVMQLVEQGVLRLDQTVGEHLDDVHAGLAGITLGDLLSHGAGISRDSDDPRFWSLDRPFPGAEALDEIIAGPLDVLPATTEFKYSNVGYGVLGRVLEAATGKSYEDVMREAIIKPLGLARTVPDLDGRKSAKYAAAHSGVHTSFTRHRLDNPSAAALAAATGFTSTAAELARIAAAMFTGSGELLSDGSKRRMRQSLWATTERDGSVTGYGLGTMSRTIAGETWIGHGGGWPGHSTRTLWHPELGVAVSVLTNAIDGQAEQLAIGAVELLMATQQRHATPLRLANGHAVSVRGEASAEAARGARRVDLRRFTGRYENPWTLVDIVLLGDSLFAVRPADVNPMATAQRLTVIDDSTLRQDEGSGYESIGELIRFAWDARGRVQYVSGAWNLHPARPTEPYLDRP